MLLYTSILIFGIGLLVLLYFRTRHVTSHTNIQEGFNPLKILKSFSKFGGMIKKFTSRFKYLKQGFAGLGPAFSTMFVNVGIMSAGVFTNSFNYTAALGTYTFDWMKCFTEKIKSIHICFLFYILDLILYFYYILIRSVCVLLDELLRVKKLLGISLEKVLLQSLDQIMEVDAMIHSYTGIHIFRYPDIILNTCYKCKKQPNKGVLKRAKDKFDYDFYVNYPKKADDISKRFKAVGDNFKKFF